MANNLILFANFLVYTKGVVKSFVRLVIMFEFVLY